VKFATLASCFERLNVTSSRNDMTALLARLLAGASPDEIGIVCYFTLGAIAPGYSGVTPGIGERTAAAAIALTAGVDPAVVEAAARELGDYGDAAARLTVAPPEGPTGPLTVTDVHRGFMEITRASGPGSADRKTRVLAAMLAAATPPERRYLVRLATGEMRLGAGDMTLLDALAEAFLGSKAERPPLEHAYNISSDIGLVARTLQESGLAGVSAIPVTLHRPIRPMLTQRVSRISEIPERIGSRVIAVEEKYDGERVQAHKDGDDVTLFSRRLTDVTHQYPDIVRHIRRCVTADTAILDGEAVALDHETGTYRPFQTLMRRRRKHRVREVAGEIPATYRVFDLLYVNGESYLRRSYPDRRARLEEVLSPDEKISPADRTLTGNLDGITEFTLPASSGGLKGSSASRARRTRSTGRGRGNGSGSSGRAITEPNLPTRSTWSSSAPTPGAGSGPGPTDRSSAPPTTMRRISSRRSAAWGRGLPMQTWQTSPDGSPVSGWTGNLPG